MNKITTTVVQCWDDGVTSDVRLIETLKRHGAKATFNLSAGLYKNHRQLGWIHMDTEVIRLGWDEMRDVYQGFTIANHSLTHPYLDQMPVEEARRDIVEGRDRLQQFFGQPVLGFAYPFGSYNDSIMRLVSEAGHVYARTGVNVDCPFPVDSNMAFHPCCHFLASDLWQRYETAKKKCGVFYFWGHSYELLTETMWRAFDKTIERISADPESRWGELVDLFDDSQ